jgi:hypothetical protein
MATARRIRPGSGLAHVADTFDPELLRASPTGGVGSEELCLGPVRQLRQVAKTEPDDLTVP